MADTDFGTDVECVSDLDPTFQIVTGRRAVVQRVLRRWQLPRGFCDDDPNAGTDVRLYLNRPWTRKAAFDLKQALEREALKDAEVYSCAVSLTLTTGLRPSITVEADITTTEGETFTAVVAITSVTLELLGIK
jgi:hypothetical protein